MLIIMVVGLITIKINNNEIIIITRRNTVNKTNC